MSLRRNLANKNHEMWKPQRYKDAYSKGKF